MKHIKAMAIKFVATIVVLFVILNVIFGMSFTNVFFISLVLSVVSYLVGDIGILSRTNNTIATIADFGLSLIVIWFLSAALTFENRTPLFIISLISAAAIALVEIVFHKYVSSYTFEKESDDFLPKHRYYYSNNYQTEASKDITPEIEKNKENK
ncbi:YndM family protein [Bacillus sporothermodurans]|uniref:YndM family protein n=1 Tax=Heyndrickxia sporothermodurans TaxID=46224 RepID=A0AB37HAF2_9BACI|nr:YndM family protein [Heyndrickxia sporothermodurans]MBL5772458.1 YndM family protein [Heyndrickxia sporothermodurans]MBL5774811.1 YndM family protein [Heyndrickxia sporothermodurans]MBL5792731.1 YndM family protein [Heyndrickxia sporothermodurans]MBL5796117.1 YndM family protein [Heyndrickxia sporothermodurans]MBL5807024.1 YndM family protein [Heyndrickxia sporothermodurans]